MWPYYIMLWIWWGGHYMPSHSTQPPETPEMLRARPVFWKSWVGGGFCSCSRLCWPNMPWPLGAGESTASFWLSLGWLQIPTRHLPPGPYCPVLWVPVLDLLSGEDSSYASDSDICPGFPGGLDTMWEHLGRIQGIFSTALTWELGEWDFLKYRDQGKGVFLMLRTSKHVSFGRCYVGGGGTLCWMKPLSRVIA